MSAQIITALRKRADALDTEAGRLESAGASEAPGVFRSAKTLRLVADEFRALADTAEAR